MLRGQELGLGEGTASEKGRWQVEGTESQSLGPSVSEVGGEGVGCRAQELL